MNYQDENARAIDRWVEEGWEWGRPISHEQYAAALRGEWDVLLTPTKPVPHAWFGELKGKKVLGLASGGGPQNTNFSALGGGGAGFPVGVDFAGAAWGRLFARRVRGDRARPAAE